MSRLSGFIKIIRPVNSIMLGFSIIIGVLIAGGYGKVSAMDFLFAWITGFTLTGAAMVVNDYFDCDIDKVNEPNRPIPSGQVKPNEAIAYSFFLSLFGLITTYLIGIEVLIIAFFSWCIMIIYSVWGKRTGFLGNLMVSTCISLPFIYGGVLAGKVYPSFLFSALAFLSNTGREITKGIVDIEGDKMKGIKTIAVIYGAHYASIAASIFYLAAIVVSVAPVLLNLVSLWYIPFVVVTDFGLLYNVFLIISDPSRGTSRKVKNQILLWMLFGLLAFALGSLIK